MQIKEEEEEEEELFVSYLVQSIWCILISLHMVGVPALNLTPLPSFTRSLKGGKGEQVDCGSEKYLAKLCKKTKRLFHLQLSF